MEETSTADKLIGEIREMYNASRKNTAQLGCNLIDDKIARRESAKKERSRKQWCVQSASEAKSTKTSISVTSRNIRTDNGRAGKSASDKNITLYRGSDKARMRTAENGGNMSCCASIGRSAFPGNYPTTVRAVQRHSGVPKVMIMWTSFRCIFFPLKMRKLQHSVNFTIKENACTERTFDVAWF